MFITKVYQNLIKKEILSNGCFSFYVKATRFQKSKFFYYMQKFKKQHCLFCAKVTDIEILNIFKNLNYSRLHIECVGRRV